MNKKFSYICIILAALLWGCMGILVRTMNQGGLSSAEVVTFRSFATAAVMLVGMVLLKRKELHVRFRDIWCFVGTGILSVVFFNICYFSCMKYCTLSTAAILLYTAPAFVMAMSFFLFKERFTKKKVLALCCSFAGCVLVSGGFGGSCISWMGLLTGLGAGFGYALYSIFGRYALQKGYSSFTITTYTFLFAAMGCLPITGVGHIVEVFVKEPELAVYGLLWTFLTTVAAYLLYTKGLAGMEAGRASVLATVEPVMASVVGFVLFQESFTWTALVGICFVLVSSILIMKE